MSVLRMTPQGMEPAGERLAPLVESLLAERVRLAAVPVATLLDLFDDFARRLMRDERARSIEGVAFLCAWLSRRNLQAVLELNLNGNLAYLDGFVACGRTFMAARPQGLVAMWLAGNVPTLPLFSLVPALLAKNVCLAKVASPEPAGLDQLLAVLAESEAGGLCGADLLKAAGIVWFDYRQRELNEELSLAADAKIVWGGEAAVRAITGLPRREHCTEIIFGPKYSIGLMDRKRLEGEDGGVEEAVAALVRDIAAFDQRACSSPQTIFVERNSRRSLDDVGRIFARHLARLPAKPGLDAYTTMRILDARAAWSLDEARDVIASGSEANWTVCMDHEVSLKAAVQSRTVFLTEVDSWRQIVPLLSPKVQTAGIAFADAADAMAFADAATAAGVARCVRPGLMNHHESPWDGKLLVNQLVRWVTFKP